METNNIILKSVTGSELRTFNQILTSVIEGDKTAVYYLTKEAMVSDGSNIYELFKSITNSEQKTLNGILNDIWDEDLQAFRVKVDVTGSYMITDSTADRYFKISDDGTVGTIKVIEV